MLSIPGRRLRFGSDRARLSLVFICVGCSLSTAVGLQLLGPLTGAAMAMVSLGCGIAAVMGPMLNRPRPVWPWFACSASNLFFVPSGLVRAAVQSTGDLTASRNLLPDALALPGYLCFIVGLWGMLHHRRRTIDERSSLFDGMIICLASLLIGWVLLVGQIVADTDLAPRAKAAILAYPPLSVVLVALAAILAFSSGAQCSSHRLVLAGMVSLLIGDVTYLLVETHAPVGEHVPLAAYGVAFSILGGAALHPSMRMAFAPASRRGGSMTKSRLALTAGAIVLPAALLPFWRPTNAVDRLVVSTTAALLGLAAAARFATASREQARTEARLAYEATHDGLTGLPNRTLVIEHLATLIEDPDEGHRVALVFLDLDQFKRVNDSLGHAFGDALLQAVSHRLRTALPIDAMVARLSGDEFVIIGSALDKDSAMTLAEGLRVAIQARPFEVGQELFVTASVGVTVTGIRAKRCSPLDLVREADTAMYHSKSSGRDGVTLYEESMGEEVATRVSLERQLRLALLQRELTVHYQPIVSLETGEIVSFEALARWQHRDGPVPPSTFIPIAEDAGLIVPLGIVVLEEACAQLAQWRGLPGGRTATMSVNLSGRQLREASLVDDVRHVLRQYNLPGSALWLEVTESIMLDDSGDTSAKLHELRRLGVRLSVDDFGTGYSSLSYLKKLPVSRVKIDRSFVSDLAPSASDRTLVKAIIAMAAALEMDTIAEGIERPEQAQILTMLGCTYGQGYLFSRPIPPEQFQGFVPPSGSRTQPVQVSTHL